MYPTGPFAQGYTISFEQAVAHMDAGGLRSLGTDVVVHTLTEPLERR